MCSIRVETNEEILAAVTGIDLNEKRALATHHPEASAFLRFWMEWPRTSYPSLFVFSLIVNPFMAVCRHFGSSQGKFRITVVTTFPMVTHLSGS